MSKKVAPGHSTSRAGGRAFYQTVLVSSVLLVSGGIPRAQETMMADGMDSMFSVEEPAPDYMKNAARLAVGERRDFSLPEFWPQNQPLPNSVNNCLRCHISVGGTYSVCVGDFASSTHDRERLSCDMCHGGDTTDDEFSHSRGGYIGTHPTESGERCTDCHWVPARIFKASPHYINEYNWEYPSCYTCHSEHAVGKGGFPMADACTDCHGARATAMSGEGESAIIWKGPANGTYGNSISITLLAGGPNVDLSIEHETAEDGTEITIHLETNSSGEPISFAEDVIYMISSSPELVSVIYCEEGDGYLGEDVVEPTPRFTLDGGTGYEGEYPNYIELIEAHDSLWNSLRVWNKRREGAPTALDETIVDLRKRSMALIHASELEPDPGEVEAVVNRMRLVKEQVDGFLHDENRRDTQ